MVEALGQSSTTQLHDMGADNDNIYSPAYAIYEHGKLIGYCFSTMPPMQLEPVI